VEGQIAVADGFAVMAIGLMLMPVDKDEFDKLQDLPGAEHQNAKSRAPWGCARFQFVP